MNHELGATMQKRTCALWNFLLTLSNCQLVMFVDCPIQFRAMATSTDLRIQAGFPRSVRVVLVYCS